MKKHKELSVREWLDRAVDRTNTRFALGAPWNDSGHAIATDGHRMHIYDHPLAKSGYLDGRDAQPPTWQAVMPDNTKILATLSPLQLPIIVKRLAQIGRGLKLLFDGTEGISLEAKGGKLRAIVSRGEDNQIKIPICAFDHDEFEASFLVDPTYLADAIAGLWGEIKIEQNPKDKLGALLITGNADDRRAVIMPMRSRVAR